MKISHRDIPKYYGGGITGIDRTTSDWYNYVHIPLYKHILDMLKKYGERNDYGYWLNDMLHAHSLIYNAAGGNNNEWVKKAYKDPLVKTYQERYAGADNYYNTELLKDDLYDYNQLGIQNAYNKNIFTAPGKRVSGDNPSQGYVADSLYSSVTDWRRLLGRKGDWNEESDAFKTWQKLLNEAGWETYLDESDNYYKLRRFNLPPESTSSHVMVEGKPLVDVINEHLKTNPIDGNYQPVDPSSPHKFDWTSIGEGFKKVFNNPNIWSLSRLGLNLAANEKIYGELLKGIKPDLKQTYNTYRQVVGDEATKQAYYRRAAQGQTGAARPFTSDADRQMAYLMEAKRVGDELRALGDLADNQEIRRTSDESNQHLWANTQRATEVANANIASINLASALKHNLLALKHAANFSSVDNAIKEIQYRKLKLQEEEKTLNDQIFALLQQYELLSDPRIIQAQKDFQAILDKHKNTDGTYDWYNDEVRLALKAYNNVLLLIQIELFNKRKKYYQSGHNISFARKGTRITRRNSDNILYMSTRDVIEHFREMTKLSSDAQNRKKPKIEKLTSHPKGSTRKYLLGGVAPFLVYTPITLGGETTTSSSVSTSNTNSEDKKGKEALDLVKDLFKELAGKGLQIDVNTLYRQFNNIFSRSKAFGEELSTEDILLMYLLAITSVNNVVRSKDIYDKAKTVATNNGALNEIAVDAAGNYVVLDKEGLVKTTNKSLSEITEEGLVPVTNLYLLYLREYSPLLFGLNGDLFIQNIITNGMGINQIGAQIKSLAGSLGHTESKIEGLTEVLSLKVKAGVLLLEKTDGTPDGIYEVTTKNLNSLAQINAALEYIQSMLSPSQLAILRTHGDPKKLITNFLSSQTNIITEQTMTGLTGKAASGKSGDNESIKSNFLDLVQRDLIGIDREFSMITKDGNSKLYSLNAKYISQLPNVDTDMSIEEMLGKSKIGSIMDSRLGVTFGDLVIAPENFKDIMFDLGGGATIVTLPCKYENEHKVVNFAIKDEYDNAVNEVSKTIPIDYSNPTFVKALSEKLHEKGLDSLLSGDSIDPNMLGHFMVVSAYTTDKINFNTNSRYVEKVKNPNKSLEERIIKGLSTNKDKNDYEIDIDDKFGWFELTWDDIYRGSVFIPLNNDPVSALTGWGSGDNIKLNEARDLAEQYQNFLKSLKQKESSSSVL